MQCLLADLVHLYKQKLTIGYSNFIMKTLFPDAPITDFFLSNSETDLNFKNTLNFKDLNIQKDDIISIFIEEGILPKNFMSLSQDPNQLPRLRSKSN